MNISDVGTVIEDGRLVLPESLAHVLLENPFIITVDPSGALLIFNENAFQKLEEQLGLLDVRELPARNLICHFMMHAVDVEANGGGIPIPEELLKRLTGQPGQRIIDVVLHVEEDRTARLLQMQIKCNDKMFCCGSKYDKMVQTRT